MSRTGTAATLALLALVLLALPGGMMVAVKARRGKTLNRLLGKRVGSRVARFPHRGTTPTGKRLGVRWQAVKR